MARTRIIAVDDDRRILRVLKRACESVGYEVHSVLDAEFFESAFRAFEPSLVFLDLNMSNIDGFELLRFIAKERADTAVAITSGVDEQIMRKAQLLGLSMGLRMLEPIKKPLMVADIRRRLKTFHERPEFEETRTITEMELDSALKQGRLDVAYQPMVSLSNHDVVCAEALARIRRSDGTLVPPAQFIPLAERTGRINALTDVVLNTALESLTRWQSTHPGLQIAVNLSTVVLREPDVAKRVGAMLCGRGVRPQSLVLEVTETGGQDGTGQVAESLSTLRELGVHLSLDDFGASFCSLGQLYEFPYETLKLDRKFAIRARSSREAAAMIKSSLDLARSVGLTVVAEGIQSEETLVWLTGLGCDVGQGFHISPPMTAAAFGEWIRTVAQRTNETSTAIAV